MSNTLRTLIAVAIFATSLVFVTAANARPRHGGHHHRGHHGYPVGHNYGYYPGYPYAYPGYPVYNVYPMYPAYPNYSYYNGVVCAAGNGYGYFWQAIGYQYYDAAQRALQMCYWYSPYCQVINCYYR